MPKPDKVVVSKPDQVVLVPKPNKDLFVAPSNLSCIKSNTGGKQIASPHLPLCCSFCVAVIPNALISINGLQHQSNALIAHCIKSCCNSTARTELWEKTNNAFLFV